ncbi:MAG TPA: metalloregulator ArsR/SmtB family transcription factor [Candidatus Dormibacteraeota bacterium]|nr:metalloregulator ArsR/SmtB family transcription factor [Candidatus Dormibacteraeota bacterium]
MQTPTHAPDPARRPARRAIPGSIAAGASDLSVAFEGLANPTRLRIVESLAGAVEMRVSELAALCMVSQPRMSWHLRILRKAEIIRTRRDGREVYCRLDRDSIAGHLRAFVRLVAARTDPGDALTQSLQPVSEGIS